VVVLVLSVLLAGILPAPELAMRVAPSPLLRVDQHRHRVVDVIVNAWRDTLVRRHGAAAAETETTLHISLMGLRADRLMAASLAASYATVEALVADAGDDAEYGVQRVVPKNLGDANAALTYTPVNPCRILDTRVAGGALAANAQRQFDGYNASSFA
jgi:hypothetical protein